MLKEQLIEIAILTIVGTSASPINPLLDGLANYGGTVPTRRLQPTSPAIDKGSFVSGVFLDGRGVIRPYDDILKANPAGASANGADIGAFELIPTFARRPPRCVRGTFDPARKLTASAHSH